VIDLPEPSLLVPVEATFWTPDGAVPETAELVVRGSPITAEKLLSHALRQAREYSYRGTNLASISGDVVLSDWPLDRILSSQLATYTRYATCVIPSLHGAGFGILATGAPPHVDVVLPALDTLWAEQLAELLRPNELRNPFKSRR
jgi:hypothetical protein